MNKVSDSGSQADRDLHILKFLEDLLYKYNTKPMPPELAELESFRRIYDVLVGLKEALKKFSEGDFELSITQRGTIIGYLKTLQGNFRHLAWQCKSVADGDLNQRVDFMGELSASFNRMTDSLALQYHMIEEKQRELTKLTQKLQQEVKRKEEIANALQVSEEMYRQKSLRDPLTGIYNRSYFFESASREMETLKRQEEGACCILMIDIDHFKKFNDTFGHICGDLAIKMVTGCISKILRRSDIFARYGGEEFVLFLSGASLGVGTAIAERIRQTVADQPFPVKEGPTPITVSIGLCALKSSRLNPLNSGEKILMSAIADADAALYAAKEQGRNAVCIANSQSNQK